MPRISTEADAADAPVAGDLSAALAGFRAGVLHGRLQGRKLRPGQASLLRDLLPAYAVDASRPIHPATLFEGPIDDLRLEIGFGAGEHLIAQATESPRTGFIGCEPFRNGLVGMLQHLAQTPRANLRLFAGDGGEVVDQLPAASVSRVDLLYPDPWPKRRQRKRRFVSAAMLARLARILRPGGTFRFATDIDDYAGWTLARVLASPDFDWTAVRADDWRHPWAGWTATRYEAKAKRDGRAPVYLVFTRR